MFHPLMLIFAAAAALPNAAELGEEPNPKAMSQAEIRVFNASLTRAHPYFIRCVRSADTGSLVARNFSCRTNRQWNHADDVGNDNARETIEVAKPKFWNTSG